MIDGRAAPNASNDPDCALDALLERNRLWVARKTDQEPTFFARLVGQQRPRYFWIGCSDSRVPATEIVDLDPGEMFVHRNVANIASSDDPSFSAGLMFAVQTLRVEHILVVGHYGCGGIHAALQPAANDTVSEWLRPIRDLAAFHADALDSLETGNRNHRLCELNVIEQVRQVARHPVVRDAWESGCALQIHGLVYGIGDGLLARICNVTSNADGAFQRQSSYKI